MKKVVATSLALQSLAVLCCAGFVQAAPSLTIYNQNFGVVRDNFHLDLKKGANTVTFPGITSTLEPDSVILRDATGKSDLQIVEQNYRNDPITQARLLSLFEGRTIDFQVAHANHDPTIVLGKVVRSGYTPPAADSYDRYRSIYQVNGEPIVEVDGKLQFSLPGLPLFPRLPENTDLAPTLSTILRSSVAGPLDVELGYVTSGMSWKADYNLVSPEKGDDMAVTGWITMNNATGKSFKNASIKLMAGQVSRVTNHENTPSFYTGMSNAEGPPAVTQKTFDEYHLYSLANPTTLRDKETKQVEFVHAEKVKSRRAFVYDGAATEYNYGNYSWAFNTIITQTDYGIASNKKVWVLREFDDTAGNGLGIPLPAGRLRFYRRDSDGSLQFVGENTIDHTPQDETVRAYTGNSFDLVGERKQTALHVDGSGHTIDETIEVRLRNHKSEPVEIRVVEHMQRSMNWKISESSDTFKPIDASTIEFRVKVDPNAEKVVTYSAHYTW